MKKLALVFLFLGMFTLSYGIASADIISILPSQDTYVKWNSTSDFSGEGTLETSSNSYATAFTQGDLSTLPTGATINSATATGVLAGYGSVTGQTAVPSIYFHEVNKSWVDSTIVWTDVYTGFENMLPVINDNFFDTAVFAEYNLGSLNAPYSEPIIDLTAQAQAGMTGDNFGVALTPNYTIPHGINFYSLDTEGYPDRRPYLEIDYTVLDTGDNPVPEPATMLLFCIGLITTAGFMRKNSL